MPFFIDPAKPKRLRRPPARLSSRTELSRTVTHTHYTVGGKTYHEDELVAAREVAAAIGLPVQRCRYFDVMYSGLRTPRMKTVWDVIQPFPPTPTEDN